MEALAKAPAWPWMATLRQLDSLAGQLNDRSTITGDYINSHKAVDILMIHALFQQAGTAAKGMQKAQGDAKITAPIPLVKPLFNALRAAFPSL